MIFLRFYAFKGAKPVFFATKTDVLLIFTCRFENPKIIRILCPNWKQKRIKLQ
jgi:hypothetical protein